MTLKPHVRKWWDIANDRRGRLIAKKYNDPEGLTGEQAEELLMLQGVASAVLDFVSPARKLLEVSMTGANDVRIECPGCGCTQERCDEYRGKGAVACCPECCHSPHCPHRRNSSEGRKT